MRPLSVVEMTKENETVPYELAGRMDVVQLQKSDKFGIILIGAAV